MSKLQVDQLSKTSAGADTFVLPAADGTSGQLMKTDGSGNLGFVSSAAGGKVLQVVTTTLTGITTSTTSTSFVDLTGMTVSITPSAASSKVLIMVCCNTGSGDLYRNNIRLMRDSTPIFIGDQLGSNHARSTWYTPLKDAETTYNAAGVFLDSPSTTSATTYKLQWACETGASMYLNRPNNPTSDIFKYGTTCSTITVMEVGV